MFEAEFQIIFNDFSSCSICKFKILLKYILALGQQDLLEFVEEAKVDRTLNSFLMESS